MKNPIYTVEFKVDTQGIHKEVRGFENVKTAGFFEPGWTMPLLWHDIFEHWHEETKYFKTAQLSQAGECVAMGIRQFIYENSNLIDRYSSYNKYHGVECNNWNVCIGQCVENLPDSTDEDGNPYAENANEYPNDFNYTTLPDWDKTNQFEGYAKRYAKEYYADKLTDELANEIELAYSYGYWLGEKLFSDKLNMIYSFCENLKLFLDKTGIGATDYYSAPDFPIDGEMLTVKVGKKNIVAEFCGVKITANQSEETAMKQIRSFLNKMESELIYY